VRNVVVQAPTCLSPSLCWLRRPVFWYTKGSRGASSGDNLRRASNLSCVSHGIRLITSFLRCLLTRRLQTSSGRIWRVLCGGGGDSPVLPFSICRVYRLSRFHSSSSYVGLPSSYLVSDQGAAVTFSRFCFDVPFLRQAELLFLW